MTENSRQKAMKSTILQFVLDKLGVTDLNALDGVLQIGNELIVFTEDGRQQSIKEFELLEPLKEKSND